MRYRIKKTLEFREKEVIINLEDIKYMTEKLKKDKNLFGFIFGLESE